MHSLALACGYFGSVLGVLMVIPQIVRTLKNRTLPGVSAMTWALTALSCLTWMLYGFRADEPPQIPGNFLMVIGAAFVAVAVVSTVPAWSRGVRLALLAALVIIAAVALPPPAVGFLAFGIGLISAVPQTVRSIIGRRSPSSGVSVSAWFLRGAAQVFWLIFAVIQHDVVITISAIFLLSSCVLLVAVERSRPTAVPVEVEVAGDSVASDELDQLSVASSVS